MNNLTHVCVCICVYTHWYSIHSLFTWQTDGLHWPRQTTTVDRNHNPFNAITLSISYPGSWFKENTSNLYRVTTEYSCPNYNFHTVKMVQGWEKKSSNTNDVQTFWMNDSMSEWVGGWMSVVWIREICQVGFTDLTRHRVPWRRTCNLEPQVQHSVPCMVACAECSTLPDQVAALSAAHQVGCMACLQPVSVNKSYK